MVAALRHRRGFLYLLFIVSFLEDKLRLLTFLIVIGVGSYSLAKAGENSPTLKGFAEPVMDDYFGKKIADPCRWMETGLTNPHFRAFLKAQNQATQAALAKLSIPRAKLLSRIESYDSTIAVTSSWCRAGNRIFYLETAPKTSEAVLRVREPDGKARTLFAPKSLANDGKPAAIDYYQPSIDGRYVVVGISLGGSENSTLHVLEVATAKLLPDAIPRTQYGNPYWRSDGNSFFYFHQPKAGVYENAQTFLHVLGTDPEHDRAVFGPGLEGSPDIPKAGFNCVVTSPNSPYLIGYYSAGTTDPPSLYVARLNAATSSATSWKQIVNRDDKVAPSSWSVLIGPKLYVLSIKESPNASVLVFDLDHLESSPHTVVAPSETVIDGIYGASDALYFTQRNGVGSALSRLPYESSAPERIPLPVQGPIFTVDASANHPGILFGLDSWIVPPVAYRYDPEAKELTDTGIQTKRPQDFSGFAVREVQVPSTDGASVPVSIITQKDILLDGSHPTLFEGYGAYGYTVDPAFSPDTLPLLLYYTSIFPWVERGGVFAVAHVRGGGEYGERWHLAGQKSTKQHTVDDMISTARYLIGEKYTSPERLAVRGDSAGGISVGNSIIQHPELFAAAIDSVGITNLLRFQLTSGGPANIPEFGDVTKREEFNILYSLSAYHQIKDGTRYPAVLALTGVNDPRVPSWMVAEFAARLQHATSSDKPVLLRVDFQGGHGFGASRTQGEQAAADQLTFLLWQLGDKEFTTSPR
jgi:prolyl oligopeptidase